MQYLFSVIDDGTNTGSADEMAAIDVFNQRLQDEGHWVFAGGMGSPESATVIDNRGAQPIVTDGPFVETKEESGCVKSGDGTAHAGARVPAVG